VSVCVCVCVCLRARACVRVSVGVCVCVCVCVRERDRERGRGRGRVFVFATCTTIVQAIDQHQASSSADVRYLFQTTKGGGGGVFNAQRSLVCKYLTAQALEPHDDIGVAAARLGLVCDRTPVPLLIRWFRRGGAIAGSRVLRVRAVYHQSILRLKPFPTRASEQFIRVEIQLTVSTVMPSNAVCFEARAATRLALVLSAATAIAIMIVIRTAWEVARESGSSCTSAQARECAYNCV
jgi:hypothetical protein